ncbi:MAG: cytochrome c biogenesis protein CcsA [Muribaculaceae bacterium]|nr:cytochrome c biogenesis protein CcsA [Muribaculaceae bacterium]
MSSLRLLVRNPFTLLIHIAFVIIVAGAIVTHFSGIQGSVTLKTGEAPVTAFSQSSGPGEGEFPFSVSLEEVETIAYPGTMTPMDFRSILSIGDERIEVSMNHIGEYSGWRFYQTAIGRDSSTLSVSHDPVGIGVTYTGYILLGIGIIGFFFQPHTPWRSLLRKLNRGCVVCLLLTSGSAMAQPMQGAERLPAMQRPLARNLGKSYVYWNDRVCPMQTMARDITATLYGKSSYEGYTSEQVLSGWLFYFDEWWRDYRERYPEIKELAGGIVSDRQKKLMGKLSLIRMLGTGEAFRIYPYQTSGGTWEWLSLIGRRPSAMSLEQWKFMQRTLPRIKQYLLIGKNIEANGEITHLIEGQKRYGDEKNLPSDLRMELERAYNDYGKPMAVAIICFILTPLFWFSGRPVGKIRKNLRLLGIGLSAVALVFVAGIMGAVWYLSGHVPLSNGPETMLLMAFLALWGTLLTKNNEYKSALTLIAGVSLSVASMGGSTPQIGLLMPVLGSPLLSVHVLLVMTSYVLFMLMALLSAAALLSHSEEKRLHIRDVNLVLLTPAVFLLAGGIFIGAVWANQSWGRYWGWDPKETCAVVMLLIYSVPLHWGSGGLRCFRKPRILHIYLLGAVLTVIFTYFGANYLLPGMHSYA